ncbi:hypothetical protein KIK06_09915 [Nocardiopsis sp. EMB25]|uniref:hypothetical protein n=1 Tax=Nocardiopsis sp. EMB25 TaxID=2835867 RepID=UPI002284F3FE|nr:hypothetical protein [Nocardiopsis sp. EMB25]MCY9784208.1 hypothetical protein [Nocardiopsis sp. EMB25]
MSADNRVRAVLDAPRGHRFARTRTGTRTPTRQQRLLNELRGNPRVAYRQAHGELPAWMRGPPPPSTAREPALESRRRPHSHRKPRSTGRHLATHALAALTGALVLHLAVDLL